MLLVSTGVECAIKNYSKEKRDRLPEAVKRWRMVIRTGGLCVLGLLKGDQTNA